MLNASLEKTIKFQNILSYRLSGYLSSMVCAGDLNSLLESSEVVGNIRFSHPTLYVFPGGQGDSALFGINGFNMLGEFLQHYQNISMKNFLLVIFS